MGKKKSKKSKRRQLSFYQLYSPCITMVESLSHDDDYAAGEEGLSGKQRQPI
jgi:hypothetical protein